MALGESGLPERLLLLHVGPHKTGTTAIQDSLHQARSELAARGIRYPGVTPQPMRAVLAATGAHGRFGGRPVRRRLWTQLLAEINDAPEPQVVLSSEFFASAGDEAARRILRQLSKHRPVRVVVTVRPLARILPSQWQQYVQNGFRSPYDKWLEGIFDETNPAAVTPSFWKRHDHGAFVTRWAGLVGPENLTVVVVDERDRESVLRSFETLLGLPEKFLALQPSRSNRSLTAAEIEFVRQINVQVKELPWARTDYGRLINLGATKAMKSRRMAQPDEARIRTPRRALELAAQRGAAAAEEIRASGVAVLGDLDQLGELPDDPAIVRDGPAEDVVDVPIAAAVVALLGLIDKSGVTERHAPEQREEFLNEVGSADLLKIVARRVRRRLSTGGRRPASGGPTEVRSRKVPSSGSGRA